MNVLLILAIIAALAVTIYGLVKAFGSHDTGWGIGILVGWFFGLGWIVAIIYLVAIDRPRSTRLT